MQKGGYLTRVFDAPREMIYKAWTDPKIVEQWLGPNSVFTPIYEVDAKPGGRIYIVMEAGEEIGKFKGTQWPMEGEFVELDEPEKIVFNVNAINEGKVILEHQTTVKVELQYCDFHLLIFTINLFLVIGVNFFHSTTTSS